MHETIVSLHYVWHTFEDIVSSAVCVWVRDATRASNPGCRATSHYDDDVALSSSSSSSSHRI